MRIVGEIPGGNKDLKTLLYPFYTAYPFKFWSKYRWRKNRTLKSKLLYLNEKEKWLTVVDRLGAPGDAMITANVIRCIKENYPKIKVNCITPHPELVKLDPFINSINSKETFYSFDSSYWELLVKKEKSENIIAHNLRRLGIKQYEYKAQFYLSEEEKTWASKTLGETPKPIVAICTKSKEHVKNWPLDLWRDLMEAISSDCSIIHLGDNKEPQLKDTLCFAGKHSMRESAALLSLADLFIGPDSLLMHIASGLDIPSIIIFGGSRPVNSLGYSQNVNLATTPDCCHCWIHDGYETCEHSIKCMNDISVNEVFSAAKKLLSIST
jgi:ADP-heptose:LPS heptosyltransferase